MSCTLHVPTQINELITNLSIVGLISKDQKLNIRTMSFSPAFTWGQAFYRAWHKESRTELITFLRDLLDQTLLFMDDYKETKFLKIIVNHLNLSRKGIVNLLDTYCEDPNIIAQLQVIIENIDIQLERNRKLIMNNFQGAVILEGQVAHNITLDEVATQIK